MTFEGPYRSGKHYFMLKGDFRLTIPNPHAQDIDVPLLKEILKRASINREQWLTGGKGLVNEFFIGEDNPVLIHIPAMVLHGFKAYGSEPAYV